jgi:hypothetical protein
MKIQKIYAKELLNIQKQLKCEVILASNKDYLAHL